MKRTASGDSNTRRQWNWLALCCLCVAWIAPAVPGDLYSEDSVKAAFVLRFASYVEWPQDAPTNPTLRIAVLGASNIATSLQKLVSSGSVTNRKVEIRRIVSVRDIGDAQVLYLGTDRRGELRSLLAPLKEGVLVITNEEDALNSGSAINLLVADHRVRFEVSMEAARLARLRISSELLSLAVRVQK